MLTRCPVKFAFIYWGFSSIIALIEGKLTSVGPQVNPLDQMVFRENHLVKRVNHVFQPPNQAAWSRHQVLKSFHHVVGRGNDMVGRRQQLAKSPYPMAV